MDLLPMLVSFVALPTFARVGGHYLSQTDVTTVGEVRPVSVQPMYEPDPYDPANALHVVPEVPGRAAPPGLVAIPRAEYDRIRRLSIAHQMIETKEKAARGDFSGFTQVTEEERASGELNA